MGTNILDSVLARVDIGLDRIASFRNAGFDSVLVENRTSRGTVFWRKVFFGLPKIPTNFLDGVFYLYPNVDSAKAGKRVGGTGFFVAVPSNVVENANYIYAVTNWHVAIKNRASVLRVNTKDGATEIISLCPEDWEFDAVAGHDIAIAHIKFKSEAIRYSAATTDGFASRAKFDGSEDHPLGVGDDTFMVGRFVDHDGGPTNQPAARFGHISIGPSLLRSALGKEVETICLDTNSRTGFSGSPVYVYRTMTGDLEQAMEPKLHGKIAVHKHPVLMLLGVHTGQFPEYWDYREGREAEEEGLSDDQVKGLSGMTRVAPAWAIQALLDMPKFKAPRDLAEAQLAREANAGAASTLLGSEGRPEAKFGVERTR